MTLHHSPWGPDSGDCDVTPALPGKRLSTKIMLLSTSATRSLLTLAHTLVRKYGDGGVTRGIYIIYKNRYIYIDRCECYEEAQKARNGQEGHEGPTKTHEKLRRPTKGHEGPRRPTKGHEGPGRGPRIRTNWGDQQGFCRRRPRTPRTFCERWVSF